ncbi:hypothetical protein GCM10012279_34840 [Micromonospora yangpuensis]|nr:hypothetical protein GCM10012279_34840 [Micromonospora yangpuensis]
MGGELREAYLAVAAAGAALERTAAGCAHPAIRQARRCGEDALDLAAEAERMLSDGAHRLRAHTGHQVPASIGALIEVLETTRRQLDAAADQVREFPARVTTARQQLLDSATAGEATDRVAEKWEQAAGELGLMTASLAAAAGALTTYTRGLSALTS